MPACLFPKLGFVFNGFVVNLFVERKFDGDFGGDELSAAFGKPDFAETAASEFFDKGVKSDLLIFVKHNLSMNQRRYKVKILTVSVEN
jgi:hypothetical protein